MKAVPSQPPLIHTKLHRPPVTGFHVHRQRLLDRLDFQASPLTLVCAPAGYGKSTLVSCWAEQSQLPVAWLSVEESDNRLRRFLSYLLASVQTAFPKIGHDVQAILRAQELPSPDILASLLINELDKIEQDFILAIDDFHVIREKTVHQLLDEILKHPPRAMHLVLAGRVDPPLSLATLRAKGLMTEIRMRDLRFSREETAKFLKLVLKKTVTENLAETFETKTEGWIAGLHLAAISLQNREDLEPAITDLPDNNRFVIDYLVAEILLAQSSAVQECLLKTSILDRFCAPLCDELCHSEHSSGEQVSGGREFIQHVIDSNLFVIPLDNENRWYRYHHLFQELLKRRAKQRFKPADINRLHSDASNWFSENGLVEEALQHAIEADDLESASQLIARHRHDIMNSEQWHRLDHWLSMLSPAITESSPDILILKSWLCETWMRLDDLRTNLAQLETLFSSKPPDDSPQWKSLRAEFYTLRALLHYIDGEKAPMIELSQKALEHLVAEAQNPRSYAQCMLAFGYQMKGDLVGAYDVLLGAINESEPGEIAYQCKLSLALSLTHWIAADLNSMHRTAERIASLAGSCELPESVSIAHHLVGIFNYLQNDLAKADKELGVVVHNYYEPNMLNFAHSAFAMSLSLQAQNKSDEAQTLVDTVIRKALDSRSSDFLHLAEAFQAELFLRQGLIAKSQVWASNYNPRPFDAGYRFYVPQFTYVRALLAVATPEKLQEAADLLTELHGHYSDINNTRFLIEALNLQALLFDQLDNGSIAQEKLSEALALAEPGGFVRLYLDLGQPMARLLERLVESQPDSRHARQILDAFGTEQDRNKQALPLDLSPALPEPLTSREVEVLNVLSSGSSNQKIADTLFISPETVKRHLYNIFQKLDVKNRQQAIARAQSLGL